MLSWKTEEGPFQAECLESHVEGFGAQTEGGKEPLKNCKQNGAWSVDIIRVAFFYFFYFLCSPIIFYFLLELTFNIIFYQVQVYSKVVRYLERSFCEEWVMEKIGKWRSSCRL